MEVGKVLEEYTVDGTLTIKVQVQIIRCVCGRGQDVWQSCLVHSMAFGYYVENCCKERSKAIMTSAVMTQLHSMRCITKDTE
jgi:hypothetical protein